MKKYFTLRNSVSKAVPLLQLFIVHRLVIANVLFCFRHCLFLVTSLGASIRISFMIVAFHVLLHLCCLHYVLFRCEWYVKLTREVSQEMPQSRSTAHPRQQKERLGTNNNKTYATYKTTNHKQLQQKKPP